MRLEEITAEIRPRTQWESVDLGVALTRKHFPKLAAVWLLTTVPIWALCIALLRHHPAGCLLLVVFLRPVYERPILFYLSRALFNAAPPVLDVIRSWPRIVSSGLLRSLTIARFSPVRSLLLPIFVLEGVSGHQYRNRRAAITRSGGSTGTSLTLVCALLELVLAVGFTLLIIEFIPENISPDWGDYFLSFATLQDFDLPPQLAWFALAVFLTAMSFVELFYVGCGFALYLNSRSHVEGWDIEITFRRLAAKLRRTSALLVGLVALLSAAIPPAADAQYLPDRDAAKEQIRDVLADEDFTIHKKIEKFSKRSDSDGIDLGWLAFLGEVIFWLVVATAAAGLGWIVYANRHLFTGGGRAPPPQPAPEPLTRTVMGLDIASDSLPDDIPAAALAAWQQGDSHLATSLLYRGSICWLVETARLPLHSSDTESDCIRHASSLGDSRQRDYFSSLTTEWIRVAYNETAPSEPTIRQLCATWPFDLGRAAG